jgi:hypothetical protein
VTQLDCVGTWQFCSTGIFIENQNFWAPGQPDFSGGVEFHSNLWIDATEGTIAMNDLPQTRTIGYICE